MTEYTHLEAIRLISGIFKPEVEGMTNRLYLCNLISRNALGLADDGFTDEECAKIGIKIRRTEK